MTCGKGTSGIMNHDSPAKLGKPLLRIGRKHAARLRNISRITGFLVPLALTLLTLFAAGWPGAVAALIAALSASLGVVVERWLFFAEAKHTVTLYYGARRV